MKNPLGRIMSKIEDIPTAMDEFYDIVNEQDPVDAPDRLVRAAGAMDATVAITALARLLTIVHARGKHDRARLANLNRDGAAD